MGTVHLRRTRRQHTNPSGESPEPHPGAGPMRRVVCRFTHTDVARLDALRMRFPKTKSRAAVVRAICLMGLASAEQAPEVTP